MKKVILSISAIIFFVSLIVAQKPVNRLTLDEVIQMAKDQSARSIQAKNNFIASYWEYRTYKANLLPNISFNGLLPSYSKGLSSNTDKTGTYIQESTYSQLSGNMTLTQNVGLTGGRFTIKSSLVGTRALLPNDSSTYFSSTPVTIGFTQPLFGFNSLRWEKKIEPLKYEEAKRTYIQELEDISMMASRLFFDMILAQQNMHTAKLNFANSDTLYKIAKGRYNIGTIAENELLQMELSYLNAGSSVNEAEVDLQLKKLEIKSFLGLNDIYDLELVIPDSIPKFTLVFDEVLNFAKTNNPNILMYQRQILEANRTIAEVKSKRGLAAELNVNYGLNQVAPNISDAYIDPLKKQDVSISLTVPILDWGKGKGQVKMAQSRREVVKAKVDQSIIDFEQTVFLNVMQFNMQDDQVMISKKADMISQSRYNVTKERFLIGKIDVLDLNVAQTERDAAKQKYINTLSNFWQFYYNMRKLTLYDFDKKQPLETDFELLLK